MKRSTLYAILAFAALLALISPIVHAATQESGGEEAAAPRAVIDETVYDAGRVDTGTEIVHDFIIRNEGTAPLHITDVRPACGCTVAEYDETIPAGGSGKIHALLDTSAESGGISKGITVLTDDPQLPRLVLTIKAAVNPAVFVRPGYARFIQPRLSEPGVVHQVVFSEEFEGLEVLAVESPYPFLEVSARPATEEEMQEEGVGKQWVVTLTMDYERAPIGALADFVELKINHPRQRAARIPVSGFVRPMVVATPSEAAFEEVAVADDGSTFGTIVIKNYAQRDIRIEPQEVTVPGVQLEIEEVTPGREFHLRVTLTESMPMGAFRGTIRLKTDHPKKPSVEIPLSGTRVES